MRRVLAALALVLALAAPAGAQAAGDPPLLTLEEAVRLAMEGNRQIQISSLDVQRSEQLAGSYRSQMFPSLQLKVQQARFLNPLEFRLEKGALGTFNATGPIPPDDQVISTVNGTDTLISLRLTQPLTQLHKLDLAAQVQERGADAARETVRARRNEVASQVRQAYFRLLDARNALAAAEDSQAFYEEFERVVQEYLDHGTALRSDLSDVQAGRARSRLEVLTLRNGLATGTEQLNALLGRPLDTPFRVAPVPEDDLPPPDPQGFLEEALAHRPEVLEARLRLEQAEAARELQRADYVPDVGVALSYDRQTNSGLLPPESYMLLVEATYDLFDAGKRDHEIAEKDLGVQQARRALDQVRDQVELELRAQLRTLEELRVRREAGRLARQTAEEKLRVALTRHQHRAALTRDVLQAEADLAAAQREYHKILLDQASARAELDRILGRDP